MLVYWDRTLEDTQNIFLNRERAMNWNRELMRPRDARVSDIVAKWLSQKQIPTPDLETMLDMSGVFSVSYAFLNTKLASISIVIVLVVTACLNATHSHAIAYRNILSTKTVQETSKSLSLLEAKLPNWLQQTKFLGLIDPCSREGSTSSSWYC